MRRPAIAGAVVFLLGWFVLAWGDEDPILNCPALQGVLVHFAAASALWS